MLDDAKMGRMAEEKISLLYLETVEASQNKSEEPCEVGNAEMAGIQERKLSEGILGNCRKRYAHKDHYKRKTRTGRILQHPRPIRVLALMRLNRRVPNGTHGGVRGRLGN